MLSLNECQFRIAHGGMVVAYAFDLAVRCDGFGKRSSGILLLLVLKHRRKNAVVQIDLSYL